MEDILVWLKFLIQLALLQRSILTSEQKFYSGSSAKKTVQFLCMKYTFSSVSKTFA